MLINRDSDGNQIGESWTTHDGEEAKRWVRDGVHESSRWTPMATAPRDGTTIWLLVRGRNVRARWSSNQSVWEAVDAERTIREEYPKAWRTL